jgi:hypothetical protein
MPRHVIDPMDDATRWSAVAADGTTASTELTIEDDATIVGSGVDGVSARIVAGEGAVGHRLRRSMPALDISGCSEVRLSIRADRIAGRRQGPLFLQLRFGSDALPLTAAANRWHRLLPVRTQLHWETVQISLDDLPPNLGSALTQIELRCLSGPFTAHLDDLIALTPQLIADADRALTGVLSGISVAETAATVAVRAPAEPALTAPGLDILHLHLRPAPERVIDAQVPRDYTTDGYRLSELGTPYDLDYVLRPVADTRSGQVALLEAAIERLAPLDELNSDGVRLPIALVPPGWAYPLAEPGPILVYRVGVRGRGRLGDLATAIADVQVSTVPLEVAG